MREIDWKSFICRRCGKEAGKYLASPPRPIKCLCADCLLWERRTASKIVLRAIADMPPIPDIK